MNTYQSQYVIPLAVLKLNGEGLPLVQLLPDGKFSAVDGRPGQMEKVKAKAWILNQSLANSLIKLWQGRQTPLAIDYEHQSINSAQNGVPAPAAGWIESLSYEQGKGLFGVVKWTKAAKAYIEQDEYRFISPVFKFDPKSGAILELKGAALTNTPALDGMDAVTAKIMENNMNKFDEVKKLLGLDDADDNAVIKALDEKLTKLAEFEKNKSDKQEVNLKTLVQAEVSPLVEQIADLKSTLVSFVEKTSSIDLEAQITQALKDGRLVKSQEAWARTNAKKNPDVILSYLKDASPIAALSTMQSKNNMPSEADNTSLSHEEEYVCTQLGIAKNEYLTQKKECK